MGVVAEPCYPAASSWSPNYTDTGRWSWLENSLLLSWCHWRKDHLTPCNNTSISSAVLAYPWTEVLLTQKLWDNSVPSTGRVHCGHEWGLCLVLMYWVPLSCFLRTTCYFRHGTTWFWSSHCTCLSLSCGQGVLPIHLCTSIMSTGYGRH